MEVEGRLVEVGNLIVGRHDPRAGFRHLPRDLGVPPLVGVDQRKVAEPSEEQNRGQEKRQPRSASGAAMPAPRPSPPVVTGRARQFSVAREARSGGGSARAEGRAGDLRRRGGADWRRAPNRCRGDERQPGVGETGVDPLGKHLPDVACIVSVAVVVVLRVQLDLATQGETPEGHPEREEERDRNDASKSPTHAPMLARGEELHMRFPPGRRRKGDPVTSLGRVTA